MKYLDLTLPTPAENLAADEAMLDACEAEEGSEVLRFWEPRDYFVVVGYANRVRVALNCAACQASGVPIFRRCSGGGAVVQGPGCLNYAVVLRVGETGPLAGITETNQWIMRRHRNALAPLLGDRVTIEGSTDLVLGARKFSGNAQRRKRSCLLFHGTFLLNLDLDRVEALLANPVQQPPYRQNRPHRDFLMNLKLDQALLCDALKKEWQANDTYGLQISRDIDRLVRQKYALAEWNLKF